MFRMMLTGGLCDFSIDLPDLLAVLEITEAIVALYRGSNGVALVLRVAAFDSMQHAVVVPDNHVGG